MLDRRQIDEIRKEFPIFENPKMNPLVYFDNGATTQKPIQVIKALEKYYQEDNGNPHRGAHRLATRATEEYEGARKVISDFIGAKTNEIIFVRNATEGINLVAYSYGLQNVKEGDEILISILEHHANLVPWQYVAKKTGAKLIYLYGDDNRQITMEEIKEKVSEKTKILALTMSSNVTGTQPDLVPILSYFRKVSKGVILLDGAQYIPHHHINVASLDCDFMV
ncbi:MAG: aminotransferase class V-fold PLP-dependent enzyme, partial [Tissierellia bacterium]|nr:aminotransferase class V-fold PLP-dependent enzyme [Tissierellia bacterium]